MRTFILRSLRNTLLFSLVAFPFMDSSSLYAHGGRVIGGDSLRQRWVCRADAIDGSGLFFLGVGRTYGEAYGQAQNTCIRSRHTCTISCNPQFSYN
jgi:hypothetical protein